LDGAGDDPDAGSGGRAVAFVKNAVDRSRVVALAREELTRRGL
jgi:hypothetical protein